MSTLPPPLPAAPAVQRRPGASFVTVLAWFVIAMAALGVVHGLVQVLMELFMPAGYQLRMLNPGGGELPPLPPLMQWYYTNTMLVSLASLLMSAAFLAASWGLLRRREWARRGFIALLVLATLWQLSLVWVLPQIIEGTLAVQMGALPPGELDGFMDAMGTVFTAVTAVMVLVFFVLHAWIIWKLCTPAVRAEFHVAS